ncbi:LamG domain-containing protein [Pontiellaceae bacterium B12227]|nr:LamG domain-containing protein [Pontiellaceae bacterium B12227]
MKLKWIMIFLLVALSIQAEKPWRFLLLADWHSAEKYTQGKKNPSWLAEAIAEDVATVQMLKTNYGGELILMPGDSNGGHWDTPKFIKNNFPGATAEESVLEAGRLCYSGMIDTFREGGYSKLIMAVGDHEMGDNPWPAGSDVSRCQPQFRTAFAKEFNRNPDGGRFLYENPIGKAASRPLGTKYEETSYACRHKNVLFITVDAFYQEDPDVKIGAEGSVTGTVTGPHLQWLENVLSEARKDEGIKHILVQSHLPVIYPVRKVNSSGMLMDDGVDNPFWKLLRKYKVDIYFAGEVHANTVTKDPKSDLVQLVTRGNFFNNFQTLDIKDDRIDVVCYEQKVGTKSSEGDYAVSGKLIIDKSGRSTTIDGAGELALLDVHSRLFHFTFEEEVPLFSNPIMGLSGRGKKENAKTLRGVKCTSLFPNLGSFGKHYSALTANVELMNGPHGKAGQFNQNSRMGVFAMGPHHSGHAVSYALWVQSTSSENQLLINSGTIWGQELKNFFNLHLNDGVPEVMVSKSQWLAAEGIRLNDGEWHHLAAVMPKDSCLLSEVQIFVDGKPVKTRLNGNDLNLHFNQAVRLGFGGLNYTSKTFNALPVQPFVGSMDEISIWARSLESDEVLELSSVLTK